MAIKEIKHPLIEHKIGLMRAAGVSCKNFRELASEVGNLLTYEATRELETEDVQIQVWNGSTITAHKIKGKKITVVPILRAGLGMLDGVLQLILANEHQPDSRQLFRTIWRLSEKVDQCW